MDVAIAGNGEPPGQHTHITAARGAACRCRCWAERAAACHGARQRILGCILGSPSLQYWKARITIYHLCIKGTGDRPIRPLPNPVHAPQIDLELQLRRLYPELIAEAVGPTGTLSITELLRRLSAAPDSRENPASAAALASSPPDVFTVNRADPQAASVRLELQRVMEWWCGSDGGCGGASDNAGADGDGPIQLGRSVGEAAPAAAAAVDIPHGTPLPASSAADPAASRAPHLPSLAASSSVPHADLHGTPLGPTPAHDIKPYPAPAGPSAPNALPTSPTETVLQLKVAALKIGTHAPADDVLAAVAAALPGSDLAATIRRRCALLLPSLRPGESQGPLGPHSMTAVSVNERQAVLAWPYPY